jgi:hypothetical protein
VGMMWSPVFLCSAFVSGVFCFRIHNIPSLIFFAYTGTGEGDLESGLHFSPNEGSLLTTTRKNTKIGIA